MIIECMLCGQKNNVEMRPSKERHSCDRCGGPLNVPSYVREKEDTSLKYATKLKNLFSSISAKWKIQKNEIENKEKTQDSFLSRMGNVIYGAGVITSIMWSVFVINIALYSGKNASSIDAIRGVFSFTIIGWVVILGTGWVLRYLLTGTKTIGWEVEFLDKTFQKYNYPVVGKVSGSALILSFLMMLPPASFLLAYYTNPDERLTTVAPQLNNISNANPREEKPKLISPNELELIDIRGGIVANIHSDISFQEILRAKHILGSRTDDREDEEPNYFKVVGSIKNNSFATNMLISLNVRIFMCDEINEDKCVVVGDETDSHTITIPPNQMRSFRSVVGFYNLPKLNKWRWDYRLTKVEAVDG
jgi:hypothetical protein